MGGGGSKRRKTEELEPGNSNRKNDGDSLLVRVRKARRFGDRSTASVFKMLSGAYLTASTFSFSTR